MRINSNNLCKAPHIVPDTWPSINVSFIWGNLLQVLGSTVPEQDRWRHLMLGDPKGRYFSRRWH